MVGEYYFGSRQQDFETPCLDGAACRLGVAVVPGEHVVEAFLVQHVHATTRPCSMLVAGRVGEEADLVHVQHVFP